MPKRTVKSRPHVEAFGAVEVEQVERFALKELNALIRDARAASPAPEPKIIGWSKCKADPMRLLEAFPDLGLADGHVLRAYQFATECGNGNAVVFACPPGTPFPDPVVEGEPEYLPYAFGGPNYEDLAVPPGAVPDVMSLVTGDGSPWSFLCASLFDREIGEFGANWHGCNWITHHLLDANPFQLPEARRKKLARDGGFDTSLPSSDAADWKWSESPPEDWQPRVSINACGARVVFFTYSALGGERIFRHEDVFGKTGYSFECEGREIATGPAGFEY